jgi:hypothetical protein
MKTHMGALSTLALLAVSLPNLLAQGNQPSRQEDPTAQAPATRAPATPPTFPTSEAKQQSDRPDVRVYMGAIVQNGTGCASQLKSSPARNSLRQRESGDAVRPTFTRLYSAERTSRNRAGNRRSAGTGNKRVPNVLGRAGAYKSDNKVASPTPLQGLTK